MRWVLGWALPSVAVPALLGVFGGHLPPAVLPWLLAAVVGWQIAYGVGWHARAEAGPAPEEG